MKVLPCFFLAYLGLHSDPPQISTTKINILIEIYQKSSYFLIKIKKNIEKSRKITKVSTGLKKSQSRPKSTVLAKLISIVETNFLKLSRFSRPSRLTLFWCRDQESRSRPRRDKSRPPCLVKSQYFLSKSYFKNISSSR